jgi:hypothetical protein
MVQICQILESKYLFNSINSCTTAQVPKFKALQSGITFFNTRYYIFMVQICKILENFKHFLYTFLMIIKYLNKYITTKYKTRADQSGDEKVVLQKNYNTRVKFLQWKSIKNAKCNYTYLH